MSLIPSAHAQDAAPAGGDPMFTLIMFGALFLFMWFIVIRPQRKRQKEHQALVNSLSKGDEVIMTSGMLAKVTHVEDDYVVVKASDNVELRFQKVAVHAVLPKGTIKSVG
jgi:preprotein translocase subunit YajC